MGPNDDSCMDKQKKVELMRTISFESREFTRNLQNRPTHRIGTRMYS